MYSFVAYLYRRKLLAEVATLMLPAGESVTLDVALIQPVVQSASRLSEFKLENRSRKDEIHTIGLMTPSLREYVLLQ